MYGLDLCASKPGVLEPSRSVDDTSYMDHMGYDTSGVTTVHGGSDMVILHPQSSGLQKGHHHLITTVRLPRFNLSQTDLTLHLS